MERTSKHADNDEPPSPPTYTFYGTEYNAYEMILLITGQTRLPAPGHTHNQFDHFGSLVKKRKNFLAEIEKRENKTNK